MNAGIRIEAPFDRSANQPYGEIDGRLTFCFTIVHHLKTRKMVSEFRLFGDKASTDRIFGHICRSRTSSFVASQGSRHISYAPTAVTRVTHARGRLTESCEPIATEIAALEVVPAAEHHMEERQLVRKNMAYSLLAVNFVHYKPARF